jgi:hypothetical protein
MPPEWRTRRTSPSDGTEHQGRTFSGRFPFPGLVTLAPPCGKTGFISPPP